MQKAVAHVPRRGQPVLQWQPNPCDDSDGRDQIGRESQASLVPKGIQACGVRLAHPLAFPIDRSRNQSDCWEYFPMNRVSRSGTFRQWANRMWVPVLTSFRNSRFQERRRCFRRLESERTDPRQTSNHWRTRRAKK